MVRGRCAQEVQTPGGVPEVLWLSSDELVVVVGPVPRAPAGEAGITFLNA